MRQIEKPCGSDKEYKNCHGKMRKALKLRTFLENMNHCHCGMGKIYFEVCN